MKNKEEKKAYKTELFLILEETMKTEDPKNEQES